jgi:hypothetical protein
VRKLRPPAALSQAFKALAERLEFHHGNMAPEMESSGAENNSPCSVTLTAKLSWATNNDAERLKLQGIV